MNSLPPIPRSNEPALFETDGIIGINRPPVALSFGMGLNSAAMIIGLMERGTLPDVITAADTGGEKPETYRFLFQFDAWLAEKKIFTPRPNLWIRPPDYENLGLPEQWPMKVIMVVKNDGIHKTLEQNCLTKKMLPSRAYGLSSCADKYKIRPQHKWMKQWAPARRWWMLDSNNRRPTVTLQKGETDLARKHRLVVKLIGYDASEQHRPTITDDDFYLFKYPLREWGWDRSACADVLKRHAFRIPVKSACFY